MTFSCLVIDNETDFKHITDWRINGISVVDVAGSNLNFSGSEILSRPFASIRTNRNILTLTDYNSNRLRLTCEFGTVVHSQYFLIYYRKFRYV